MATFHLQIVTPDRMVFDGQAERIIVRTLRGDVCILARHIDYAAPLGIGEARVTEFLAAGVWVQPLIAAFIGLIPNCASSVVLTQTYLLGGITFGSCLAGLCANAGLGLLVLLRNGREYKRNLCIILVLYAVGIAVGYAVNAIALAFGA